MLPGVTRSQQKGKQDCLKHKCDGECRLVKMPIVAGARTEDVYWGCALEIIIYLRCWNTTFYLAAEDYMQYHEPIGMNIFNVSLSQRESPRTKGSARRYSFGKPRTSPMNLVKLSVWYRRSRGLWGIMMTLVMIMCLRLLSSLASTCNIWRNECWICPWLWCHSLPSDPSSHRQVKPQLWAIAWDKSKNCPTPCLQTCFSHVPEGKGRLQSRERRCAPCRWTRRSPWPPRPHSPWIWRLRKCSKRSTTYMAN